MKEIGIIAEDNSDIDVIREFLQKMAKTSFRIQKVAAGSCSKIPRKCRAWAEVLRRGGCTLLILVHDLDNADLTELQVSLARALAPLVIRTYIVVIPVREIEAWLLADHEAIRSALGIRETVGVVKGPEAIQRPKEYLRNLIYRTTRHQKRYLNTLHNRQIAARCKISNLRRCQSFHSFERFVTQHVS